RRARDELSGLSRRRRPSRRLRRETLGLRARRATMPPVRQSAGRDARDRRTHDGAMRALSRIALLKPPTSDEQLDRMRAAVRADAVDRPGVYRMISGHGEIVYVGKSKRLRTRLLSYFRCAFPEDKGSRILREAERIEWEYTP